MKNGNNDISSLEEQMANNDDICCSCGIVTAFPKAFFDNYRVAGVGIMVCTSGSFTLRCGSYCTGKNGSNCFVHER